MLEVQGCDEGDGDDVKSPTVKVARRLVAQSSRKLPVVATDRVGVPTPAAIDSISPRVTMRGYSES